MNFKEYVSIVYLLVKNANDYFEKVICRRAANVFNRVGDKERALYFKSLC